MDTRVRTVLLDNQAIARYNLSDPTFTSEASFEAIAQRLMQHLYPDCFVILFKPVIRVNGSGWKPDLAIIDKKCEYWFVVEIEISTHSLDKHVLPQVRAIRDGEFDGTAADWIARGTNLSSDLAGTLIRYVPRYTLVVSNYDDQHWENELQSENIQFMSMVSFEKELAPTTYLVTGLLHVAQRSVGFGNVLPAANSIRFPFSSFWKERTYKIIEPGGTSNWDCTVDGKTIWLTKSRGVMRITSEIQVQAILHSDGSIFMRPL